MTIVDSHLGKISDILGNLISSGNAAEVQVNIGEGGHLVKHRLSVVGFRKATEKCVRFLFGVLVFVFDGLSTGYAVHSIGYSITSVRSYRFRL